MELCSIPKCIGVVVEGSEFCSMHKREADMRAERKRVEAMSFTDKAEWYTDAEGIKYAVLAQTQAIEAQTAVLARIADALEQGDKNAAAIAKAIYSNNQYN